MPLQLWTGPGTIISVSRTICPRTDVKLRAAQDSCPESIPDRQSTLDIKWYFPLLIWHNSIFIVIESMFWKLTRNCTRVHWCELSLKSSSRIAIIWAEIKPKRWPCWKYSAKSPQLASESHQQGTWGRGAVVNPQLVIPFRAEVGKLHFDNKAVWYGDAPATVLAVRVVVRVVRACKLAKVLPTDGGRASWK